MGTVFLWLTQRCAKKKKKRKGQGQERVMEQEDKYIFYINTQKNYLGSNTFVVLIVI